MMTREDFLKAAAGAAAFVVSSHLSALLEGCAPSAHIVQAQVTHNSVIIPRPGLPDFGVPDTYVKVYVESSPNPFLVFAQYDGELIAVHSTCSHSGCEVQKLRNGFECPCHGSEYDLRGLVVHGPAPDPLDVYPVVAYPDRLEFSLEDHQ